MTREKCRECECNRTVKYYHNLAGIINYEVCESHPLVFDFLNVREGEVEGCPKERGK